MSRDERHRTFFEHCCRVLDLTPEELRCEARDDQAVLAARKAIPWLMREHFEGCSYPILARVMHRDHTTVMSNVKRFQRALELGHPWALRLRDALKGIRSTSAADWVEAPADALRRTQPFEMVGALDLEAPRGFDMTGALDMPEGAVG